MTWKKKFKSTVQKKLHKESEHKNVKPVMSNFKVADQDEKAKTKK